MQNTMDRQMSLRPSVTQARTIELEHGTIDAQKHVKQFKKKKRLISLKPKKQQLFAIYHLILNQRNFVYQSCKAFTYQLTCLDCRSKRSIKRRDRTDYQLDKGIEKLEQHLDVTKLIKRAQIVKVIENVLFNQDEKFLLNYQKCDVIDYDSSSSSSCSQSTQKGNQPNDVER